MPLTGLTSVRLLSEYRRTLTAAGYDQGVFSGVIVTQDFLKTHNLGGDEHTQLLGTVVAIYDIGCFFGALIAAWLGEAIGRRRSVLIGTTVMTVGAILQISSYSTPQMIVGRIVAGIGKCHARPEPV